MRVDAPTIAIHDDEHYDKDWARRYILDPLTAPEPSQETGPGASHVNQYRAATEAAAAFAPPAYELGAYERTKAWVAQAAKHAGDDGSVDADDGNWTRCGAPRSGSYSYVTPPSSASPPRNRFHLHLQHHPHPGPLAGAGAANATSSKAEHLLLDADNEQATLPLHHHHHHQHQRDRASRLPTPIKAQQQHQQLKYQHQHRLQHSHRRYPSVPVVSTPSPWADPDPAYLSLQHAQRPRSSANDSGLYRQRSLSQRFPGDMSHRPLDMLKADNRAADRRPHRHRKRLSETDTIDALDTIGGAYHHGGPYDATLTSRNLDQKYSPVAAVRESNLEALRATPRENIIDSLRHHVPLQGTAAIPSGETDMDGNIMSYAEGADLMREPDADGGAYKRWPGVLYHPDDLKGKGEPSFTIERDLKARKHRAHLSESGVDAYEMQPSVNGDKLSPVARQRSISNAAETTSSSDLQRSPSAGKKISDGLKRRFGSLRRKRSSADE